MNPTDTIIALEKALEAYDSATNGREEAIAMGALMNAISPDGLRGLFDAHASALRDAARYRALRMMDWFDGPLCVVSDPKRLFAQPRALGTDCPSRDRLDAAIDRCLAALDDNTKGAAE